MRATTTPEKTPRMLRMVRTLLLRQPTTLAVALMLSARAIGLENGRPLAVVPLAADPPPVSGDEDLDRLPSPRLPFEEADLQMHVNNKTVQKHGLVASRRLHFRNSSPKGILHNDHGEKGIPQ